MSVGSNGANSSHLPAPTRKSAYATLRDLLEDRPENVTSSSTTTVHTTASSQSTTRGTGYAFDNNIPAFGITADHTFASCKTVVSPMVTTNKRVSTRTMRPMTAHREMQPSSNRGGEGNHGNASLSRRLDKSRDARK